MLADLVNRADVRVIERRGGAALAAKGLDEFAVLGQFFRQEFERHDPPQRGVLRFVDHLHPSSPELLDHAAVRKGGALHLAISQLYVIDGPTMVAILSMGVA